MSFKEDINITLENLYKKNKNQKKDVFKKILLSFLKDNIRTIFEKVKTDIKLSNSELSFLKFVLVEPKFIVDTNTIYDKFKNVIESQKTESADITKKKDRLTYSDLTCLKFALVDTECANFFKENWEQNESDIIKKIYGKIINEDKIERYEISFFETIWEAGYTGFFKKIWNQDEYNFVDRIKEKVINGEELTENEILYFKWGNIYGDMDAFKVVWESGQMELKGRIEKKINSHIRCTKDEILFLRAGAKMGDHDSFWMIGLSYQDSCQKEINAQLESSREAEEIFWQAINKMHMRYRADNNPFDPLKSFRKYLQTTVTRLIIDRNKEEQHIADCSPDIVPVLPPGPSISRTFLRFIEMVCIDNKPHQIIAFGMTELIHDKKKDNQWLIKLFSEQKLGDLADQFIKSYLDQFYDVMIAEKDKVHDAFLPLIRNIESPAAKCYKDKEYKPIIKRIHKTKEILFREFYHDWPDQLITFGFVEILRTEPKEIVEKYINESFEALTNAYLIERGPDFLTVMGYDALANLILRMKWRTEECYPKNKDLQEKHDRVGEIKFSEFFINTSEAERKNSIDETIKDLQKLTHKAKGQASADIALWKRRLKERAIKYFEGRI